LADEVSALSRIHLDKGTFIWGELTLIVIITKEIELDA